MQVSLCQTPLNSPGLSGTHRTLLENLRGLMCYRYEGYCIRTSHVENILISELLIALWEHHERVEVARRNMLPKYTAQDLSYANRSIVGLNFQSRSLVQMQSYLSSIVKEQISCRWTGVSIWFENWRCRGS